jgi:DNA-binding NtrC family response regulator
VVPLQIPPLRQRREDIPLLARHIITKFNERLSKNIQGISDEALRRLEEHSWPGNIRELENLLERTILFCSTSRIELSDLPEELAGAEGRREPTGDGPPVHASSEAIEVGGNTSLKDIVRAETSRVERELIVKALDETGGNVTQAAKLLKISRKSLQMKMKEFGLRDRDGN